ncbi:MAG TPA: hypothetical protein VGE31_02635 [Candidatus Paceibacterota bacterium]
MILALFTAGAVSATAVPETAYGHIAMTEEVATTPSEVAAVKPLQVSVKPLTAAVYTEGTTESIVRNYFADIPVLIEVARCESHFRHTLSDGSVLTGRVDSADTGVMQINKRYHAVAAAAMDLNLDNIYDNMAYARHLYETQGIRPWNASASCWNTTLAANI